MYSKRFGDMKENLILGSLYGNIKKSNQWEALYPGQNRFVNAWLDP